MHQSYVPTHTHNRPQTAPMQTKQFWVIGGEFSDTAFRRMASAPRAEGPFHSYDEAFQVWKDLSAATKSEVHVRYTIAANPAR